MILISLMVIHSRERLSTRMVAWVVMNSMKILVWDLHCDGCTCVRLVSVRPSRDIPLSCLLEDSTGIEIP